MKVKKSFVLKNIAGNNVVLPTGAETTKFSGMLQINETGAFLWDVLKKNVTEDDLVNAMLAEYNVSAEQAKADVAEFVKTLKSAGVIED